MDSPEVVAENLVKIEVVKLESTDDAQEESWGYPEGGRSYSVKEEVKEEEDEEGDLKPPVAVFLDPEEVLKEEVNQQHEDPLGMCNEDFDGKSELSDGGECSPEGTISNSKTRKGSAVQEFDGISNEGNDRTLVKEGVELDEFAARSLNPTENASHVLKPNKSRLADKHPRVKSLPGSESKMKIMQKEGSCHKCSLCQKRFKVRAYLVDHMRIHSGERRHQCTVCPKSFSQCGNLNKHMRIHSGERPCGCSVCLKYYSRKSHLDAHMRFDSGERPHECRV